MLRRRLHPGAAVALVPSSSGPSGLLLSSSSYLCTHSDAAVSEWQSSDVNLLAIAAMRGGCSIHSPLAIQRRFSLRYASKIAMPEMHQPLWLHDKRHGMFSYESNIGRANRSATNTPTRHAVHQNLWDSDTDASNNRYFRTYFGLQSQLHTLLGRQHFFETPSPDGRLSDSAYELNTDMRFKGVERSTMTNVHYVPQWNSIIYRQGAHGSLLSNPHSALTKHVLGDELLAIRDVKSKKECEAYWARLAFLVQLHYDAVGDIGNYKSRNIKHVHQMFLVFSDAIRAHDFQDRYLKDFVHETCPDQLKDLFAVFIEMEANAVNRDYCPRCNLPYASTHYCGEGDPLTPFRKHRGRWAPHQQWGKEWDEVMCRRAEALWYRATEDDIFGTAHHTQRQAEAMMNVYLKTQQRGKAISFMTNLRGSREFTTGIVQVTPKLQEMYDKLLDSTPHPHLLTNAFKTEAGSSVYFNGEVQKVPVSPQQLRLDLEMSKFRRMQKEEGVVRLPPKGWNVDTKSIVNYKLQDGAVVNWREVKQSIEASFLASGLPQEAFHHGEWREMLYLRDQLRLRDAGEDIASRLRRELETEQSRLGVNGFVFPDAHHYRCFDITEAAFKPFQGLSYGTRVTAQALVFDNPAAVSVVIGRTADDAAAAGGGGAQNVELDMRESTLTTFGLRTGDVLTVTSLPPKSAKDTAVKDASTPLKDANVVVLGVRLDTRELIGCLTSNSSVIVSLGTDILDLRARWQSLKRNGTHLLPKYIMNAMTSREDFEGVIVGVLGGVLHAQWDTSSPTTATVAVPLGSAQTIAQRWEIVPQKGSVMKPVEPHSWNTPFRNNWIEERLKQLERAPWEREQWVSLIPGKYTPKPKRFGYTQHTTQDDFVTKEYQDRLTSRQYFNSPNSFEVIPDASSKGVRFGAKEGQDLRLVGLPTVDRNELENGWSKQEVMSDLEMRELEQCLKDISGTRPGNFVKSAAETSSLKLNESWWAPLEYGWEQHNREQRLLDPSERKLIDGSRLPFQGRLPAFGTTYGIGERIRDVAEDFGKGFGLGPHKHSPSADKAPFNTLGNEDARVEALGYGNLLVRMFNDALKDQDLHTFALTQCGTEMNARHLLLSIKEWREQGRPPSVLLLRVLSKILKSQIDEYNAGLPAGVEKLSLDARPAVLAPTVDNVWAHTDKVAYALDPSANTTLQQGAASTASEGLGLIPGAVLRAQLASVRALDDQFVSEVENKTIQEFHRRLSAVANTDLSPVTLAKIVASRGRSGSVGSVNRSAAFATPMIRSCTLDTLLLRFGISEEQRRSILVKLAGHPDAIPLSADAGGTTSDVAVKPCPAGDYAVPLQVVMTWHGENMSRHQTVGAADAFSMGSTSSHQARTNEGDFLLLPSLVDRAASIHDGLAMDVAYTIRENLKNTALRDAFVFAAKGVLFQFGDDDAKIQDAFAAYVRGSRLPKAAEAVTMFINFLRAAAADPAIAESYFVTRNEKTGAPHASLMQIAPAPIALQLSPFVFDNVRGEVLKTQATLREIHTMPEAQLEVMRFADDRRTTYAAAYSVPSATSSGQPQQQSSSDRRLVAVWSPWGASNTSAIAMLESAVSKFYEEMSTSNKSKFKDIAENPRVRHDCFKKFLLRTLPLLPKHAELLQILMGSLNENNVAKTAARRSAQTLANILENERNMALDRDFRQNAERYWKQVLDGRGADFGSRDGTSSTSRGTGSGRGPANRSRGFVSTGTPRTPQPQRTAAGAGAGGKSLGRPGAPASPSTNVSAAFGSSSSGLKRASSK